MFIIRIHASHTAATLAAMRASLANAHNGVHPRVRAANERARAPARAHGARTCAASAGSASDNANESSALVARDGASARASASAGARDACEVRTDPVCAIECVDLGAATSENDGWRQLSRACRRALRGAETSTHGAFDSGCVRFVIDVPRDCRALDWVSRAASTPGVPGFYWSPRAKTARGASASRTRDGATASSDDDDGISGARGTNDRAYDGAVRGARAGVGASATWTDAETGEAAETTLKRRIASMRRFLANGGASGARGAGRVYGAGRFDPARAPSDEWAAFGTHYFFLPTLECVEGVTCATLAVCAAWDANGVENCGPSAKSFVQAIDDACETLDRALSGGINGDVLPPGAAHAVTRALVPDEAGWSKDVSSVISRIRASHGMTTSTSASVSASVPSDTAGWADLGSSFDESDGADVRSALESLGRAAGVEAPSAVLDQFEAMTMALNAVKPTPAASNMDGLVDAMLLGGEETSLRGDPLRKVVLARKSDLALNAPVDTFALVSRLQSRDPDAYQFVLRHPNGATFLGSTPERLFASNKGYAASEAVAGTRARGADDGEDAALAYDMLLSPKEHEEFAIVREEVRSALAEVAQGGIDGVNMEIEKGILRNVAVQHLYARLSAPLARGKTEADLISALHPTPAVCGYPRSAALHTLRAVESFDRGLYAGPLGWISAEGAEFAVAIRSALAAPGGKDVTLYAGVGVVGSANAKAEWSELNLKTKPLEMLLAPAPTLASMPNPNAAWATVLVGELVRGGVTTFCIAPGSRSTPLALAAEKNVGANVVVCIDERSLGFYALGYAKGASSRPAAVICSSGTAVANLLPAVVEASESSTPLLLLTADRPYELRDTGANQTIDQVKIFGSYARFAADLAPPGDGAPARACATMAATALRYLRGANPGPVHLNCAFREPLGPQRVAWDSAKALKGLERWEQSSAPFTVGASSSLSLLSGTDDDDDAWRSALSRITSAKRGLLVIGGGASAADAMAATSIARTLGWAVAADATSGARVGAANVDTVRIVPMIDYVLVEPTTHDALRPDVILQLGSRLTSKRLCQFLEASAINCGAEWVVVEPSARRLDPAHCVSVRVESSMAHAAAVLEHALLSSSGAAYATSENKASCVAFAELAVAVGSAVAREAVAALRDITANEGLSEIAVAVSVSERLPETMGLFLGNSMPIRDVDAFSGLKYFTDDIRARSTAKTSYGAPVTANRGASGIDGVLSTAAGYAAGLGHPVTLIVGDVSFQHDSNGLLFLRDRPGQPPVTVVVVNNGGGGIFSFLPVAAQVDDAAFNRLFATPPDVSRRGLCEAHRVAYAHPRSMAELDAALDQAWGEDAQHRVIEVTTSRARNLVQHKMIQRRCARAARHALGLSAAMSGKCEASVSGAEVSRFSIPLAKPVTTNVSASDVPARDGWLLKITLSDGKFGYGEASPLPGLHRETLDEAGAQLIAVASALSSTSDVKAPTNLALLNGAFTSWIERTCGISSRELLPSVRFALETAMANALASSASMTLARVLSGDDDDDDDNDRTMNTTVNTSSGGECGIGRVFVNALVDAAVDVDAAVREAKALVDEGHRCLKVKVGRGVGSEGAKADAVRLAAIRDAVGPCVVLRADANRRFTFTEALDFGAAVQELNVNLQYVEEPTATAREMSAFYFTTGVPTALDETVDEIVRASASLTDAASALARVADQSNGVVAVVMKPSVIGGLEATATLARVAMSRGVRPVISSAFETGVGLHASAHLAASLDDALRRDIAAERANHSGLSDDTERRNIPEVTPLILALDDDEDKGDIIGARAHGLGTGSWLAGEIMTPNVAPVRAFDDGAGVGMMLHTGGVGVASKTTEFVSASTATPIKSWGVSGRVDVVTSSGGRYNVHCVQSEDFGGVGDTVVLLHGFMGSVDDWDAIARGILASSGVRRVIAIDLPAHGDTTRQSGPAMKSLDDARDVVLGAVRALGCNLCDTHVVGYSMGARIALAIGAMNEDEFEGVKSVVSVGGSPGVRDARARDSRAKRDDELARALRKSGVHAFAKSWYAQGLFTTLVAHPRFGGVDGLALRRARTADTPGAADALAECLSAASPGRQAHVWDALYRLEGKSLFIAGERDSKFAALAREMRDATGDARGVVDIKNAGHAAHLEAPEAVVVHLTRFFADMATTTTTTREV